VNVPRGNFWVVEFKVSEASRHWLVADDKWHFAWQPANDRAKELRAAGNPVRLLKLACNVQEVEVH